MEKKVEDLMIEIDKYNTKINGMFDAAKNGELNATIYVAMMNRISDMWLKKSKEKIKKSGNKEDVKLFNECVELIDGIVKKGAITMKES